MLVLADNTVTITGNLGPGNSVTSLVLHYVGNVNVDFYKRVLEVVFKFDRNPQTQQFDFASITIVTWTISGVTSTLTFS